MKKLTDDEPNAAPEDIDLEQFKRDVQSAMVGREKVANANQAHGQTIKSLGEERGYNMQAFKAICTLAKVSSEKASDYLRTFNAGVEALQLGQEQPDLLEQAEADEDNKGKTGKVVRGKFKSTKAGELAH